MHTHSFYVYVHECVLMNICDFFRVLACILMFYCLKLVLIYVLIICVYFRMCSFVTVRWHVIFTYLYIFFLRIFIYIYA